MFPCPSCGQKLVDGSTRCQFCGTTFAVSPQPRSASSDPDDAEPLNLKWVEPVYKAICIWWMISGGLRVVLGITAMFTTSLGVGALFSFIFALGLLEFLLGLGLLLKIQAIRSFVNILLYINIAFALLGILIGFVTTLVNPMSGAVSMIECMIAIVTNGLMIFLIGETERNAPDL